MKIVVAGRFDYIRFAWQKEIDEKSVLYFEDGFLRKPTFKTRLKNKIDYFIGKINKNKKEINDCKIALREYFDIDSLKRNDEILFIIYETNFISSDFRLLGLLKRYFRRSKFVLDLTNAIGTVRSEETKAILDNVGFYDSVFTFNEYDALKYGFKMFPDISGDYSLIDAADCEEFDVFFAGRAKQRLDVIISTALRCISLGLTIKFFVSGVPKEEQKDIKGVYYIDYLPYKEMLSYIKKAKAVLNILNGVSSGIILRDEESMGMNKILITDNEYIFKTKYYTESKVIPLSELENQVEKIRSADNSLKWNYSADEMNRIAFLETIRNCLNN